jgi:hypothetical protein
MQRHDVSNHVLLIPARLPTVPEQLVTAISTIGVEENGSMEVTEIGEDSGNVEVTEPAEEEGSEPEEVTEPAQNEENEFDEATEPAEVDKIDSGDVIEINQSAEETSKQSKEELKLLTSRRF